MCGPGIKDGRIVNKEPDIEIGDNKWVLEKQKQ
jgi:hypothetical protein